MRLEEYKEIFQKMINDNHDYKNQFYCKELLRNFVLEYSFNVDEYRQMALDISQYMRQGCLDMAIKTEEGKYDELYWAYMLFEAPYIFESFLHYMEKNRPPEKKFYYPRENTLKLVVKDLQDLEDGKIKFYGLSLPPRTGKSTICIFFLAWVMGKRPNSHSAMSGHSSILSDGFYSEVLNITQSAEYTYNEIFPLVYLNKKNAEKKEITFNDPDRFATLTCRGIDGTWTGAVDISSDGYLYVDDMVRDRQESLSPQRLEKRWQDYLNVLFDRKNDGTRELMVGTRWNVLDPLGRIEAMYKGDPMYRFRKIPALDKDGNSNFEYKYGKGFSTEYFLDVKNRLDRNEWEAKYMQTPFIREGLLFPEEELRFFNGNVPEGGLVRVVTACDVAWGGGDSLSMPIGLEYENGDVYIVDWIFNTGTKEVTIPIVAGKIMDRKIQQVNFEANNGGEMYAKYIDDYLKKESYKCSITHTKAPTTMAKLTKIIQYSDDIKRKFIFLDRDNRSEEYQKAMEEVLMFVQVGKNVHDDAPDSLAQLERFIDGYFTAEVSVMQRYF